MNSATPPLFVDTHAHLSMRDYAPDRAAVVARSLEAGVAAVIDIGYDDETNRQALKNAREFPCVAASFGFHPHDASHYDDSSFRNFLSENAGKAIGLGEFGLDYFRDRSPRPAQRAAFESQLKIALEMNLPVSLHCREAEGDMLDILADARGLRGVMHCFPGDTIFLERVVELGLHIAGGGPITYPKSDRWERVLRAAPRERFLFETDCPFLSPQSKRGKRNEPAYVAMIAARVAEIWGASLEETARVTTSNAVALFGEALESKLRAGTKD